jgi:aryl carrier-like protein
VALIERSGLQTMSPDATIEASLRQHPTDPVIVAADRDRLQTFFDGQRAGETASETASSEADIAERVCAELAAALNLGDPAAVDLSASLLDLGVDSLLALDLRKRLRRVTGRSVPLAALLGGITGGELIASLDTTDSDERSLPLENSANFRTVRNVCGQIREGGNLALLKRPISGWSCCAAGSTSAGCGHRPNSSSRPTTNCPTASGGCGSSTRPTPPVPC